LMLNLTCMKSLIILLFLILPVYSHSQVNNDSIYTNVDDEPGFQGNWQEYLDDKLHRYTPTDVLMPLIILNTSFIVEKDGSITNIQIKAEHYRDSSPDELNDTLEDRCTRFKSNVTKLIIQSAPWLPARNDGFPVRFRVTKKFETDPPFEIIPVFDQVEVMPEFPGGKSALDNYIATNKIIPESLAQNQQHATVYTCFIIAEDGSVTEPRIARGIENNEANLEAIRLITNMPNWTPGKQGKKRVRVNMMLPIKF